MGTFMLIAKTVLCSVVSAGVLAVIIAKIKIMITASHPHPHLDVGWVVILFASYAVVTALVCSLIGSLIWKDSLDTNWLKIVMGAVIVAEVVVLCFVLYPYIFGDR